LRPGDVLVLNKTKVFPARLFVKKVTGGKVEILFLEEIKPDVWKTLVRPGLKIGINLAIKKHLFEVIGREGMAAIIDTHLSKEKLMDLLRIYGHTPIPPYIKSKDKESSLRNKYQTVYAKSVGSVAAPTAGFHFTDKLLNKLAKMGIQIEYVTLHVGMGTFAPVKSKNIEDHPMHFESYEIDKDVAERLNLAKKNGKRIIAVGTTSARTLESVSNKNCELKINKLKGSTNIFIYPGYKYRYIDALVTNFHLPKSTLIALVSAFVSYPNTNEKFKDFKNCLMGKAYYMAIREKYRFYSFGDSSLII
jgi:S-adenosylmethionine:tRNA ribosyltransferase-isomerase